MILASDDKDGGLKVDDDDDAEAYLVEEAPKDNLSLELEATAAAASTAIRFGRKYTLCLLKGKESLCCILLPNAFRLSGSH